MAKFADIVILKDGRKATVCEVLESGVAYIVDVPTPDGPHRYDNLVIAETEIAKVEGSILDPTDGDCPKA
ncbi:MAG: hypothetical protein Q4C09_03030 [Atopobiaceae bacterium]|nr:hypothetical protein [Atopobiaceae bacterium]